MFIQSIVSFWFDYCFLDLCKYIHSHKFLFCLWLCLSVGFSTSRDCELCPVKNRLHDCIFGSTVRSPAWIGCIFVGMETVCEIPANTCWNSKCSALQSNRGQLLKPFRRIFFAYVLAVRECASLHSFCFSDWPPSCGATPPLLDMFSDPNNICPVFLFRFFFFFISFFFFFLSVSALSLSLSLLISLLSLSPPLSLSLSLRNEYSNYYSFSKIALNL